MSTKRTKKPLKLDHLPVTPDMFLWFMTQFTHPDCKFEIVDNPFPPTPLALKIKMTIGERSWFGMVDTPSQSAAMMLAKEFYSVVKEATALATAA